MHFFVVNVVISSSNSSSSSISISSSSRSSSNSSSGGGGASDSDIISAGICGSSKILTWTGKYKPGAIDGACDGKDTLGTRAGIWIIFVQSRLTHIEGQGRWIQIWCQGQ